MSGAEVGSARHVVVMGVSGSGKSTVARGLAERLDRLFAEGDEFHSPANRAKMAAGQPLTDDDRRPWLEALQEWMSAHAASGSVVACSALRRRYRDVLRRAEGGVTFVCLDVPAGELRDRLTQRTDHFMPVSLLETQLETLEPLAADEPGFTVAATASPADLSDQIVARLV